MTTYKDLIAWQRSVNLVIEVYSATREYPREELFGLCSQMQRAAVSVPSNIAEGQGRYSRADERHFLITARGSLNELETQIIISNRLGYLSAADSNRLLELHAGVVRPLNGLIRRLDRLLGKRLRDHGSDH